MGNDEDQGKREVGEDGKGGEDGLVVGHELENAAEGEYAIVYGELDEVVPLTHIYS